MTRVAIYARYSSDNQNERSLVDQVREAREYAARRGWTVVEVYEDAAISGGSDQRPGYQDMLSAARRGRFDILLAEALDRVSRRLADIAGLFDELSYHRVRVWTLDFGEVTRMHVAFSGMMAEQYVTDLRNKTRRGQRGRIEAGRSSGGIAYGYIVLPDGDRTINELEAQVVRRIFRDYAAGVSPRELAQTLNKEGIPGPRGGAWKDTTIRGQRTRGTGILNNDLYIGRLIYGRTEYRKKPGTGKRLARAIPETEWVVSERADLRIVSDELWQAVRRRQEEVHLVMPRDGEGNPLNRLHRKVHVLSGVLICGVCGGPLVITAKDRYGCSRYRSSRMCSNSRTVPRAEVDGRVLEGLRSRLLDADLVEEFIDEFKAELQAARKRQSQLQSRHQARLKELESMIGNLVDMIALGRSSQAVLDRLESLEQEQARLHEIVPAGSVGDQVVHLPNMGAIYRRRISRLIDGLSDPAVRQESIEIIQSMIQSVVVTPGQNGFAIDVVGEIGAILALVDGKQKLPNAEHPGSSLSVVAGAGFEPAAFRL